jgi:hypothetical protein
MRLLSLRVLVPLTVLVLGWGAVHVLSSHNVSVAPAVWPLAAPSSSASAGAAELPIASAGPTSSPPSSGAIPVLPDALRQLNGSTRDTATGLYAVIQQLEAALGQHFDQLVKQLEPGR